MAHPPRRSPQFITAVSLSVVFVFIFGLVAATQATNRSSRVAQAPNAAFLPGDLVVVRVGNGVTGLTTSAAPVFLDEFTTAGTPVQTVPVTPTLPGNRRFTISGTNVGEGALNRSANGQYLTLAGYDADVGRADVGNTTSTVVNRVVARVDAAGLVDTTTVMTDAYTFGTIRSAVTDDGSRFWTGGFGGTLVSNGPTTGGTRYVTYGSTGSSTRISEAPNSTRVVSIYNNQLYVTGSSDPNRGVNAVGTGLPTTPGQPTTRLPNASSSTDPYAFVFFDRTTAISGVDTLYVADQNTTIGLQKYSFDGTNWTLRGSVPGSFTGVTGIMSGTTQVDLYATRGTGPANELVKIVDTAAFNATITATPTVLAVAPANTAFRGLAFAPVAPVAPTATTAPTETATTAPTATMIATTVVTATATTTVGTVTATATATVATATVATPTVATPTATLGTPTATVDPRPFRVYLPMILKQ